MLDNVEEVDQVEYLDNVDLTERVEVLMTEAMKAWLPHVARREGLNTSGLIRMLSARHLNATYGPGWSDGETYEQDHPQGDHE